MAARDRDGLQFSMPMLTSDHAMWMFVVVLRTYAICDDTNISIPVWHCKERFATIAPFGPGRWFSRNSTDHLAMLKLVMKWRSLLASLHSIIRAVTHDKDE